MIDYRIVEKLKDPFFLVIGAMDGISHDNLAPYIRKKRMSGIFIEPVKYIDEEEDDDNDIDPSIGRPEKEIVEVPVEQIEYKNVDKIEYLEEYID